MAKVTKAEVGFEHPAKGANHCSECRHFLKPNGCDIVRGHINAGDWCKRFQKKRKSAVLYDHPRSQ